MSTALHDAAYGRLLVVHGTRDGCRDRPTVSFRTFLTPEPESPDALLPAWLKTLRDGPPCPHFVGTSRRPRTAMDTNTHRGGTAAQQQALEWLRKGASAAECARRLGVSRQTVARWRKDADGPGAPPARRGRKPILGPDQRRAVLELLAQSPAQHGFMEGGWTRGRVQILLQRHFSVHLSLASISGLTAELGRNAAAAATAKAAGRADDSAGVLVDERPASLPRPSVPSDHGLFLAWAQHSRDAVALYDAALRPQYANAALLALVQSSFDALLPSSLREGPLWSGRLPKGYVAAVLRVAATGVSETLALHDGAAAELRVLAQHAPGGSLLGIATVLHRVETRYAAGTESAAAA